MKFKQSANLEDIKEECLTEEGKERIRKHEQYILEHPSSNNNSAFIWVFIIAGTMATISLGLLFFIV